MTHSILSIFGDEVSQPLSNEVAISCIYGVIDNRHETFSATGGSVGVDFNQYKCQSGTSVGGYGVVRSKRAVVYHPGEAIRARFSGLFNQGVPLGLQFAGLFHLTDTIAFGYDGDSYGCIIERAGIAEVQEIEVTGAAGGAESATVTLDGDAVSCSLTATTTAGNSFEITRDLLADPTVSAKWNIYQNDSKIVLLSKSVGNKTGTMSFSSATATATVTEQQAGADKTKYHIAQNDWNMDNWSSREWTLDPANLNVYQIDYGYLGGACILFSVYDKLCGCFVPVHLYEPIDDTLTNVGNPNLKIGWTAASLGSSGTNLITQGASASIQKVAAPHDLETGARAIKSSKASISTTATNLITIRCRGHYGYRYNQGTLRPVKLTINNDHNKGLRVDIIKGGTLGGVPNFTFYDENNYLMEYDTAATTITNGEIVDSSIIAANGSDRLDLSSETLIILPGEWLTVAVSTISGTATTTDCSLVWREDK